MKKLWLVTIIVAAVLLLGIAIFIFLGLNGYNYTNKSLINIQAYPIL